MLRRIKRFLSSYGWVRYFYSTFTRKLKLLINKTYWPARLAIARACPAKDVRPSRSFVYGWWGTETVGDRFILLGLLTVLMKAGKENIVILSMNQEYTEATLAELAAFVKGVNGDCDVTRFLRTAVNVSSEGSIVSLRHGDELILGGGPIMNDPILAKWNTWCKYAKEIGARPIIFGCGVGPLTEQDYIKEARELILSSSYTILRNKLEQTPLADLGAMVQVWLDPSFICAGYISAAREKWQEDKFVAINARSIPAVYIGEGKLTHQETIDNIANYVRLAIPTIEDESIAVFSMNESEIISDLELGQEIVERLNSTSRVYVVRDSMLDIVKLLVQSKISLSTRYHGLLVSLMSGSKCFGVDYAENGGKTKLFYKENFNIDLNFSVFKSNPAEGEANVCMQRDENFRSKVFETTDVYLRIFA